EAFTRCLGLADDSSNPEWLATSRFHLGHIHNERGDHSRARRLFESHEADSAFGGRFRTRLTSLIFLGVSYAREGDHVRALEQFSRADALCSEYSPSDVVARLCIEQGRSLVATGQWRQAQLTLLRALRLLRLEEDLAGISELRAFNENALRDVTEAIVGLYVDQPSLLAGRNLSRHTLLLAEENRYGIRSAHPAETAPGDVLATVLTHRTDPLIAYFIGQNRSFIWVATEGDLQLHPLPGRSELRRLLRPVLADMSSPGQPVTHSAVVELSRIILGPLVGVWLEGVELHIVPDDVLFAVPWSALRYPARTDSDGDNLASGEEEAPIAPVKDWTALVLEHGPIVEQPTLVSFARTQPVSTEKDRQSWSLLALGVNGEATTTAPGDGTTASGETTAQATLHFAEEEARQVAALWPSDKVTLRTGADAAWAKVSQLGIEQFDVLHIASHAVVHQGLPTRASLRLAGGDESPLTIAAVGELNLNAELIYLSCCEASMRHSSGAALLDFARAFVGAGARSVVASTQRVDDEASHFLAERFYTHWLGGLSKAAALRAAQRDVREAKELWQHPYFWAFYRVIGEGA
ncbi:CHAT domain-containing protein, partial [Candidatus Eisenbacteria bacterium]